MVLLISENQLLLRRQRRKRVEPVSPEHVRDLEKALDQLASLVSHVSGCFLIGGLVCPLAVHRRFYRKHSDIDLGVEAVELPALVQALEPHGYRLFRRLSMGRLPLGHRFDVLRPVSATRAVQRTHRHLQLWRVDHTGAVQTRADLLNSFDLFFFRRSAGMVINNHGSRFPEPLLSDTAFVTSSGREIRLCHLQLVLKSKSRGLKEVDRFDLAQVRRHTEMQMDDRCTPGRARPHAQLAAAIHAR